jgi:hypothetical protein
MTIESQQLLDSILRIDLLSFIRKVFATVSPGHEFLPSWHLQALAFSLAQIIDGKNNRLIINMPPRQLKSICASVALPAFILGHDPTRRIICVSYSQDLAIKHANDCRSVISSDWYRTHPGKAFHSRVDDEFPIIHKPGFLSLVIPNFGLGPVGFEDAYLAEIQPDGTWRQVFISSRVMLT